MPPRQSRHRPRFRPRPRTRLPRRPHRRRSERMKTVPRPVLVATCCLAFTATAAASAPDAPVASPPHTAPDKNETQATDMKAELQRAKDAVNSAKKPEELDPILFDLQKYENNG